MQSRYEDDVDMREYECNVSWVGDYCETPNILDLSSKDMLTEKQCEEICSYLNSHANITHVKMTKVGLTDECAKVLASHIQNDLAMLDVSSNNLTDKGFLALNSNHHIVKVIAKANRLSAVSEAIILEAKTPTKRMQYAVRADMKVSVYSLEYLCLYNLSTTAQVNHDKPMPPHLLAKLSQTKF